MNSIYFWIVISALFLSVLTSSNICFGQAEKHPERPNILFILVDDLGYADLGIQGSKEIHTPHIDALAQAGIRFTAAYVTAPQCGPSRAGIMTGINQARFGYFENQNHAGLPDAEILPLISELLKSEGYHTGMVGKWHIGQGTEYLIKTRDKNDMGFLPLERINSGKPWKRGFDEGFFIVGGGGYYFPFKKPFSNHPRSHYYTFAGEENEPKEIRLDEDAYNTDFFTDAALKFIRESKDEPFFLYLSYTAPHTPLQAKPEDIAANSHIKDKNRRIFAGMMTCLDSNIGRVLDLIDEKGLRQNTLIVFMSDNGGPTSKNTSRNDPFNGVKGDVHEGGIRVPCIMSWEGVFPKGIVYPHMVSSLDLLPTFAGIAGAKLKSDIDYDGIDLSPYLKNNTPLEKGGPHNALFWSWNTKKAMRLGDYKWLDSRSTTRTKPNYGLFNLTESDKENAETILSDPERLDELEKRYKKYWGDRYKQYIPKN